MTWVLSEKTTGLGQHSHSYSLNTSLQLKMFPDFGHLQRCSEVLRKEELLHRMLTEQLALEIRIFFNGKLFSSVQKNQHILTQNQPINKCTHVKTN